MLILAIALGMLPGLAWLIFYSREEDLHAEPKKLIALVFIAGAMVTLLAYIFQCMSFKGFLPLEKCGLGLSSALQQLSIFKGLLLILVLAGIEEILKFGATYVVINKNKNFDEPVDAMIYPVMAALGFATVENFAVAYGILKSGTMAIDFPLMTAVSAVSIRFIGATLLHTLASGVVGYYWAKSIRNFEKKHIIIYGVLIATVLHAIFNYLIIKFDNWIYTFVFLILIGFLVIMDFEKLKRRPI